MNVRSLGFRTDLMIRRLSGSSIEEHRDHLVVRTPANPNFHWGNFIVVLDDAGDAVRWLATFQAAHPGAQHVAIGLDIPSVDDELRAGYEALGLELDVSDVMAAAALAAPTGDAECRTLRSDSDWAQLRELTIVCNEVTDPREAEFVERKHAETRRLVESGAGAWFGAFADGRLASSLGVMTDGRGLGRYQSVDTLPEFRRRGLARQLVTTAAAVMGEEFGVTQCVIVADPEYHASVLYRSVGFERVGAQVQVGRGPAS